MRYYDPAIGRFMVTDRFADMYPMLTPYHYAANNPIKFIDVNGDSIQTTDAQSQQDFTNTLPPEAQKYVRFDESGKLDIDYLIKNTTEIQDLNLSAAIAIGKHKTVVTIENTDKVVYIDKDGNRQEISMGAVYKGFTLSPDDPQFKSPNPGKVSIQMNENDLAITRAKFLGEELYSHARFYLEGKKWEHNYVGGVDRNRPLVKAIQAHRARCIVNFIRGGGLSWEK